MWLQCKCNYRVKLMRLQCRGYNSVSVIKYYGSYYSDDVISV